MTVALIFVRLGHVFERDAALLALAAQRLAELPGRLSHYHDNSHVDAAVPCAA